MILLTLLSFICASERNPTPPTTTAPPEQGSAALNQQSPSEANVAASKESTDPDPFEWETIFGPPR